MARNAPEGGGGTAPARTDVNVTITAAKSKSTSSASKSTAKSSGKGATKAPSSGGIQLTSGQPNLNQEELAQQYGLTGMLVSAYPELRVLFEQAVRETWTADKFQAKLRNTQWYKERSETNRKISILQYTDPATYGKMWNDAQLRMRQLMADAGANPDDWAVINAVAGKVIFEGWNDSQARDYIGQYIVFGKGGLASGKAGEVQEKLNAFAYSMGVQNSDWWLQDAVRNVVRGAKSEQDYKNEITSQAIAAFPQYENQLRAGSTLQDLAQPYIQSMSQILEIAPGSVNMFDQTIRKAMSFKDSSGVAAAMPLWDFQNSLRKDDRWKQTQNAQDAAMGTAHKVLQDMGIYY